MRDIKPTIEDLRKLYFPLLQERIRNAYSTEDEFKMLNLGIADKNNKDYLIYRKSIDFLIEEFNNEVEEHYGRANGD